MSEYNQLIKNYNKIRNYMRDFYVYGFKTREEFDNRSLRSYDNEKRRIESYLSEYITFQQDQNGKRTFISVDTTQIPHNPIYQTYKTKTFTKNDITLNFIILDILRDKNEMSLNKIMEQMTNDYLIHFQKRQIIDIATIRNKLKEYTQTGIIQEQKQGNKNMYSLINSEVDLEDIRDALHFFSEISPLGVIGSYLLDKITMDEPILTFKHNYIMHALESEVVFLLLEAIHQKNTILIGLNKNNKQKNETVKDEKIIPLKFLISLQGGRRYLSAYSYKYNRIMNYRLDNIDTLAILDEMNNFERHQIELEKILKYSWGATFGDLKNLEWLTMIIYASENEKYIIKRLEREGRQGTLDKLDDTTYKYKIEVWDTLEMLPWIRTFTGRIITMESSNQQLVDTYKQDLEKMYEMYAGGDTDDIQ